MKKVLIVDDEPSVRFVLARTCEQVRVPWDEAGSAEEAREKLSSAPGSPGRVGLVLLDVRLPGDDGMELLGELAGRPDAPNQRPPAARCLLRVPDQAVHAARAGDEHKIRQHLKSLVPEYTGSTGVVAPLEPHLPPQAT